jgi:hypothetical protein
VLELPELGNVVDPTMDTDEEVVVLSVPADFLVVPGLGFVWTQEVTEGDYVEADNSVEEQDDENQDELLSPGKSNIGALHATNIPKNEGRDPEGEGPDEASPNATTD